MTTYEDIRNKKLLTESLKSIILENEKDYDVYLATVTFEDSYYKPSKKLIEAYFKSLYQNLNRACVNKPSINQHKKCILILFPEKSYKDDKNNIQTKSTRNQKNKLQSLDHYHAFLLIHKDNKERFKNRATKSSRIEFYQKLNKDISVIELDDKFKVCCRSASQSDTQDSYKNTLPLKAYSIDLRHLEMHEDIKKASYYMTKNFQYDFNYEDALIFCDISDKKAILMNSAKMKLQPDTSK